VARLLSRVNALALAGVACVVSSHAAAATLADDGSYECEQPGARHKSVAVWCPAHPHSFGTTGDLGSGLGYGLRYQWRPRGMFGVSVEGEALLAFGAHASIDFPLGVLPTVYLAPHADAAPYVTFGPALGWKIEMGGPPGSPTRPSHGFGALVGGVGIDCFRGTLDFELRGILTEDFVSSPEYRDDRGRTSNLAWGLLLHLGGAFVHW
jgi:hypothetical protein